jgi:hypothetical protein
LASAISRVVSKLKGSRVWSMMPTLWPSSPSQIGRHGLPLIFIAHVLSVTPACEPMLPASSAIYHSAEGATMQPVDQYHRVTERVSEPKLPEPEHRKEFFRTDWKKQLPLTGGRH